MAGKHGAMWSFISRGAAFFYLLGAAKLRAEEKYILSEDVNETFHPIRLWDARRGCQCPWESLARRYAYYPGMLGCLFLKS